MTTFRVDDLSNPATQSLIGQHFSEMAAGSPAESMHALTVDRLRDPSITVWSGWDGDEIVSVGALKQLSTTDVELKSMRVSDAYRGTGAGRALLRHLIDSAAGSGATALWLETGVESHFVAARSLYASEGFEVTDPFADYEPDPLSVFMRLTLERRG